MSVFILGYKYAGGRIAIYNAGMECEVEGESCRTH